MYQQVEVMSTLLIVQAITVSALDDVILANLHVWVLRVRSPGVSNPDRQLCDNARILQAYQLMSVTHIINFFTTLVHWRNNTLRSDTL